jgi:hypothetical protein
MQRIKLGTGIEFQHCFRPDKQDNGRLPRSAANLPKD